MLGSIKWNQEKKIYKETGTSKRLFSPKQREQLQKNPNERMVIKLTFTYADRFKSQFTDEYKKHLNIKLLNYEN